VGATRSSRLGRAELVFRRDASGPRQQPGLSLRPFPDLARGAKAPLGHDLVAFAGSGPHGADVWKAEASPRVHEGPNQELADLGPSRIGRAAGYCRGFSTTNIRKVAEAG
jgi:hypothetical protein